MIWTGLYDVVLRAEKAQLTLPAVIFTVRGRDDAFISTLSRCLLSVTQISACSAIVRICKELVSAAFHSRLVYVYRRVIADIKVEATRHPGLALKHVFEVVVNLDSIVVSIDIFEEQQLFSVLSHCCVG